MQIGLLLAVGFLALVGGVLYYRIEHPDELEHFWNGSGEQVQAKPNPGQDADTSAQEKPTDNQSSLPTPPAPALSNLDIPSTTPASAPVQLADARGTNPNVPAPPSHTNSTQINLDVSPPILQNKPTETTSPSANADLAKKEPPSQTPPVMNPGPPALDKKQPDSNRNSTQPSLSTFPDLSSQPKVEKQADKPAVNSNGAALPEPPSAGPPSLNFSSPSQSPPAQPTTIEKPKDDKSIWMNEADKAKDSGAKKNETQGAKLPVSPPVSVPSLNELDVNKPVPAPVTPAPALTSNSTIGSNPSQNEPSKNLSDPSTSPLWLDTDPAKASSPKTAPLPSPPDVTPPTATSRSDGQYREYPAPRAGLGRPVPESVLAMNERRWSDGSNVSTPIIPSSGDSRTANNPSVSSLPAPEKRIVNDTTISSFRVVQGETFSSLSQRAYGSEIYAEALAAYNHEAGAVDADQPAGNQMVLIPAKFDLENRFGHLLRKPQFRSTPTKNTTAGTAALSSGQSSATSATDAPTYRVRKGEQLFDVAKLTLGDGYRWGEIYSLNKDLLHESTELRPDMMLRLPADGKLDNGKPR
jgi:hypothetical protein